MRRPRYLYHWTHRANLRSIRRRGLLASLATGQLRAVWMCDRSQLAWAISHVAANHGWSPDAMVCIRIRVRGLANKNTAWGGVYTVRGDVPVDNLDAVLPHIGQVWEPI